METTKNTPSDYKVKSYKVQDMAGNRFYVQARSYQEAQIIANHQTANKIYSIELTF